jgi:kynurenine formamidase
MAEGDSAGRSASEIGALARIGEGERQAALRLARRGRVYDLGLELNSAIPHNSDFVRFSLAFTQTPEGTGAQSPFQYSAEAITGALHVGTHMDALIHVQAENRIFGGLSAREARDDRGWKRHGMETVPPILGRAVILDIPGLHGVSRLADRYEITVDDLDRALRRIGEEVRGGDIVLVRTGKIQDFNDEAAFQASEPGVGREAAIWLYEKGMSTLGTDTTGTEPLPFKDPAATTHRAMLVDRGVHLIENLNLEEAAADEVGVGLFICLALKLTGATGSWVRPILVV